MRIRFFAPLVLTASTAFVAACGNTSSGGGAGGGSLFGGSSLFGGASFLGGGGATSALGGFAQGGSLGGGNTFAGGATLAGGAVVVGGGASQGGSTTFGGSTQAGAGGAIDPNADADGDGFTVADGDCDDSNPNVNPGAMEVVNRGSDGTPLPASGQIDDDCDGVVRGATDRNPTCDADITTLDVTDPFIAARTLGLCNVMVPTMPAKAKDRKWGVVQAGFNEISGPALGAPLDAFSLQLGVATVPDFGAATKPQEGVRMLALSSGDARTPAQDPNLAHACSDVNQGIGHNASHDGGPADPADQFPPGFPKKGTCGDNAASPYDGVALDLLIRVPTNAKSVSLSFRFFSCEFPQFACATYNDSFAVLMAPSPFASANDLTDATNSLADIAFEGPVGATPDLISVNNQSFLTACAPGAVAGYDNCKGVADLASTGFDQNGGSSWLVSSVPIDPKLNSGYAFLRFAIWDAGDGLYDSTVVIDNVEFSDQPAKLGTVILPPPPNPLV